MSSGRIPQRIRTTAFIALRLRFSSCTDPAGGQAAPRRHDAGPQFLLRYRFFLTIRLPRAPSRNTAACRESGRLQTNVGRIFDTLKRLGVDDNTVVIYASDNGRGPGRTPQQKIRGRKLSTYEGGIRVPAIAWGPGLGLQSGAVSSAVVRAMDWYPTLATFAGIEVPEDRVIDGRDISPLLKGETKTVPPPDLKKSLNASVPLRRRWNPPGEWAPLIDRNEYNDALFYHGSQGALAAVRWRQWKLYLNPTLQLYDLTTDPGESSPVRDGEMMRKLRGMAILFQEEMRLDARPAGEAPPPNAAPAAFSTQKS